VRRQSGRDDCADYCGGEGDNDTDHRRCERNKRPGGSVHQRTGCREHDRRLDNGRGRDDVGLHHGHDRDRSPGDPGEWRATLPASELGLWQATDGTLKALINVGPTNPKEFSEVTSTTEMLKPLTQATGGDTRRVVDGSSIELPRIVPVRASGIFRGDGWMGVKMRDASVVKGVGVLPLFAGLIGLLLLLGGFAATWLREGR